MGVDSSSMGYVVVVPISSSSVVCPLIIVLPSCFSPLSDGKFKFIECCSFVGDDVRDELFDDDNPEEGVIEWAEFVRGDVVRIMVDEDESEEVGGGMDEQGSGDEGMDELAGEE